MPELKDIAQAALSLYHSLAQESLDAVTSLATGQISERYFIFMEARVALINSHQDALSSLFAYAMLPKSEISPAMISPGLSDPLMHAMQAIIKQADDSPSKDDDSDNLAMLLYSFHFLVMLFWLYDRTEGKRATLLFINFLRDFVKLTRPMMMMPLVNKALMKMAKIMMLVFGGARFVED